MKKLILGFLISLLIALSGCKEIEKAVAGKQPQATKVVVTKTQPVDQNLKTFKYGVTVTPETEKVYVWAEYRTSEMDDWKHNNYFFSQQIGSEIREKAKKSITVGEQVVISKEVTELRLHIKVFRNDMDKKKTYTEIVQLQ